MEIIGYAPYRKRNGKHDGDSAHDHERLGQCPDGRTDLGAENFADRDLAALLLSEIERHSKQAESGDQDGHDHERNHEKHRVLGALQIIYQFLVQIVSLHLHRNACGLLRKLFADIPDRGHSLGAITRYLKKLNEGIIIILVDNPYGITLVLHRLEQSVVGAEIRDDATDFIFTIGVASASVRMLRRHTEGSL